MGKHWGTAIKDRSEIARDGAKESPWQHGLKAEITKAAFQPATIYDVLVVGGGITGLTAALFLQQGGKKVVIAEAHTIGFGTTGGTSAHINTFADTTYREAESAFDKEGAQLFAGAIGEGFDLITSNIENYNIDCDFEYKPGYLYAENEDEVKQLKDIYEGIDPPF